MKISTPDKQLAVTFNKICLAILYALLLLTTVVAIHLYIHQEGEKISERYRNSVETEEEIKTLLSNLQDAETGQRGYLLTLKEAYLEPYSLAINSNDSLFTILESEFLENNSSRENFKKLKQLSDDKFDELAKTIALSKSGKHNSAIKLVNSDLGKLKMDSIRFVIKRLIQEEQIALLHNAEDLRKNQKLGNIIVVISACLIIGLFLYIYLFLRPVFEKVKNRNVEIAANQKLLQIKNSELEHFAYITSHDLKEPSRTIAGFIDAFEEDCGDHLNEDGKKYLTYIKEASQRMSEMISSILSFSKLGKSEPYSKIDLNEVILQVDKDLELLKQDNNALIESENLPTIIGKSALIRLLFQNLIANAIKFRKKDSCPSIKISCIEKQEFWEFSVEDNGIGIPLNQQDKIFNFFTKLHLSSKYEGQGIGLAFCKKIVDIHDGHISVDSNFGEGSTFRFSVLKRLSYDC